MSAQSDMTVGASTVRLAGLDALRGFALAGIIFVNFPSILNIGYATPVSSVQIWLDTFVQGRFFPIFSVLFGVGFGMIWRTAGAKTKRPRLALLRRLLFLGAVGGLHQTLQPGEALVPYAFCGLLFLLPITFLPDKTWTRWSVGIGGIGLLIAGFLQGGGVMLVPGLFLIGFVAGVAKVPARMAASSLTLPIAGGIGALGAVGSAILLAFTSWEQRGSGPFLSTVGSGIGLLMAVTYVAAFAALLHTPVRRVLATLFTPLGQMALTNYITATLLMTAIRFLSPPEYWAQGTDGVWTIAIAACVSILVIQWVGSAFWLRRFSQGPLESLWRRVTWWNWRRASTHEAPQPA